MHQKKFSGSVFTSWLCGSLAVSQFRVCILGRPHSAARRLSQFEGSSKCSTRRLLLFPLFGGCTATVLHGLTYAKILCAPKKEERKRENGDITWRRSSLLVTQPGNAQKTRLSHLTTADAANKTVKAESFEGCRLLIGTYVSVSLQYHKWPPCQIGREAEQVLVQTESFL